MSMKCLPVGHLGSGRCVVFFFAYRDYTGSILANMSNMSGLFQDMDSQGLKNKNNDDKLIGWNGVDGIWWNGVPSQTTPVWEKGKGMDWSSQGPWVLRFRCVMWWHTPLWDNLLNQMDRYYIWAPAKILYIWVVAIYGYRFFWGGLSLSRVLWKSADSRSNMKPKSIPKQARKWIEQLFCWFQVLRQHFMFLSCCIYLDAFSFMFLSFVCISLLLCIHFLSLSFIGIHVPFIFLSCSFQCAFMSSHFLSFCTHVPFISFLKLWKWLHSLAEASAT